MAEADGFVAEIPGRVHNIGRPATTARMRRSRVDRLCVISDVTIEGSVVAVDELFMGDGPLFAMLALHNPVPFVGNDVALQRLDDFSSGRTPG
jgi:hypothetical protein